MARCRAVVASREELVREWNLRARRAVVLIVADGYLVVALIILFLLKVLSVGALAGYQVFSASLFKFIEDPFIKAFTPNNSDVGKNDIIFYQVTVMSTVGSLGIFTGLTMISAYRLISISSRAMNLLVSSKLRHGSRKPYRHYRDVTDFLGFVTLKKVTRPDILLL